MVSQQATQLVQVSTVALEADPSGDTALAVGGNAAGGDTISVTATNTSSTAVQFALDGASLGTFTPTAHILVYGQGSNDRITLNAYRAATPTTSFGCRPSNYRAPLARSILRHSPSSYTSRDRTLTFLSRRERLKRVRPGGSWCWSD